MQMPCQGCIDPKTGQSNGFVYNEKTKQNETCNICKGHGAVDVRKQ